mgnify:CR=1 FL=1
MIASHQITGGRMAVTQADVDALNAAIARGARSVTLGEQTVIFNTTESLIKARDDMRKELAMQTATTAGTRRSRLTYVTMDRGYN